jgi:hypothetical protein
MDLAGQSHLDGLPTERRIQAIEEELRDLDTRRRSLLEQLAELRSQSHVTRPPSVLAVAPSTPHEKAALFRARERCIRGFGKIRLPARKVTPRCAAMNGCAGFVKNPASNVPSVHIRISLRSMNRPLSPTLPAVIPLGPTRSEKITPARSWQRISMGKVGRLTWPLTETLLRRSASKPVSSVHGPAKVPMPGFSSRRRWLHRWLAG